MTRLEHLIGFLIRFSVGYLLTIGIVFGTQWTYYNFFDSFREPEFLQPFTVLNENKTVAPGDTLLLELTFRKLDPINIASARQISCQDGDIILLDPGTTQLPVTTRFNTVTAGVPIPITTRLHPGESCVYQVRGTGQINPYRTYVVELVSEPFFIGEN